MSADEKTDAKEESTNSATKWLDVTAQVDFTDNDGEALPLTKCVCGERFRGWDEMLSIYEDRPWICDKCGAKLIFKVVVRVLQLCEKTMPKPESVTGQRSTESPSCSSP